MSLFKDHGTKLLGGLTTAFGIFGSIDPAIIQSVLGANGMSYVTAFAGILTILRGFQNTKTLQDAAKQP